MLISFPLPGQYNLALAILAQTDQPDGAGDTATHSVEVADPDLAVLLQRGGSRGSDCPALVGENRATAGC
jgi:hypothetical protein